MTVPDITYDDAKTSPVHVEDEIALKDKAIFMENGGQTADTEVLETKYACAWSSVVQVLVKPLQR